MRRWRAAAGMKAHQVRSVMRSKRDIRVNIHGTSLLLPFDHALPRYVALFPEYLTNVSRVAEAVAVKYPGSSLIDVGANVGDTVKMWRAKVQSPVLAVEGDPHWLRYLRANVGELPRITIANVFLGERAENRAMRAERFQGTSAFVADDEAGTSLEVWTPRQLIESFPTFGDARLVKTDTDGFDYAIVKGFVGELSHPPVFFFEHDPTFGDDGVAESEELRLSLARAKYHWTLWWDNFGRFLLACDIHDAMLWQDLTKYVPVPGRVHYWDVAAFPEGDTDLALSLRKAELFRPTSS